MPSAFPLNTNSANECIIELKKIQETKDFKTTLDELTALAIENDKNTWALIYQLMRDADSGKLSWALHKEILSGTIYILTQVGDSKSYRLLINYIKSLDRTIPVGALELISEILPTFTELDSDEIIKIASQKDDIRSAIGIIALSKLVIENRLSPEQRTHIQDFFQSYTNTKYYLNDVLESTLQIMEDQDAGGGKIGENDLHSLFSD
ncbi:MAG: hypothetical protein JJT78_09835 [Leptospira sp.]|nr:hypothetical protein [Leptospira sp.]